LATPKLSVVTPTYNRQARLARVLSAFERQSIELGMFEVVVVDDGSSDGTKAYLASYAGPLRLRSLSQANAGPARARNAGIEAAQGDIVVFVDDDVEPCEMLLEEHLRSHELEQNVVVMGPLASLPYYAQPWIAWEQAKVEAQYAAMTRGDWQPSFRQFWTGNASLARRHLLSAGLFDPTFLRAEDIELGLRLRDRGLSFRFNPRARGVHHAERSLPSWEAAHASYGRNEVDIFSRLGDEQLVNLLADNWRRLNPLVRWLVRSCVGKPMRREAVRQLLHTHLLVAKRLPVPVFAQPACSMLASLLYWQSSIDALGTERAAKVWGDSSP
jgi:glycosyltransferase involved in cell wall biosynthesis